MWKTVTVTVPGRVMAPMRHKSGKTPFTAWTIGSLWHKDVLARKSRSSSARDVENCDGDRSTITAPGRVMAPIRHKSGKTRFTAWTIGSLWDKDHL
jgi:hypothetical protein